MKTRIVLVSEEGERADVVLFNTEHYEVVSKSCSGLILIEGLVILKGGHVRA